MASSFSFDRRLSLRRRCLAAFVLLVASLVGERADAAPTAPLTFAEAQSLAIARSPKVAAFAHAARASREMSVAAAQLPDPVLKMGVQNVPVQGPDRFSLGADFMTMRQIGLMQEITRSDKRELRARGAELEAERSLAERSLAVSEVERETAVAWLDRRYAEAMRAVIGELALQARTQIETAQSAYRGTRGSQADVFAARSAAALIEDRASDFDRRIRAATLALARWVGDDAQRPLAGRVPADDLPLAREDLPLHIARHPDLQVLAEQEAIAANAVKQAVAARTPDWSVELMYGVRGPGFPDMVSLAVSIPLPWDRANRQDREVVAKLALQAQAQERREDMLRAHVAEVGAMLAEWETGRERLIRYAKEIVPFARERTQAALAAYRGGKGALGDVLAARRDELDARLQALQLEWDNARLWAQLAFLIPETDSMKDMK